MPTTRVFERKYARHVGVIHKEQNIIIDREVITLTWLSFEKRQIPSVKQASAPRVRLDPSFHVPLSKTDCLTFRR